MMIITAMADNNKRKGEGIHFTTEALYRLAENRQS